MIAKDKEQVTVPEDTIRALEEAVRFIDHERWIPVGERLPQGTINPVTLDFYGYLCKVNLGPFIDNRFYKFGRGHWWNGGECVDQFVIAWKEIEVYEE